MGEENVISSQNLFWTNSIFSKWLHLRRPIVTLRPMCQRNKFIPLLVALLHLSAAIVLQGGHLHLTASSNNLSQTIQNHECGTKETHHSLQPGHNCIACFRSTQSLAHLNVDPFSVCTHTTIAVRPLVRFVSLSGADYICPQRAPPVLVA